MNSIEISSYHICIEPDLDRFRFSGLAEISVCANETDQKVVLNILDLTVEQCLIRSGGKEHALTYIVDASEEELQIELPESMNGEFQLVIRYQGVINDKMAGFYRSHYAINGENHPIAVTQFQESSARMAFPCQDHPKYKARFEIEMIVDEGLTAVSNMRVRSIRRLGNGKTQIRFHRTPKMSTYLVFFGLGRFEYLSDSDDRRLGLITTPGLLEYGRFGLNFGRKALKFCERYYGIDYPLDKMDLLAVPDFAFGAMENWGAITFRENLLLDFPKITSQAGRLRICEVIAHEIAHQWFGNLVTPEDWKYLWLNESFATYFGYGVVDHYYPQWQIWEQFIYSQTQSAFTRDSLMDNFPIEIPGGAHVVINTSTAPLIYSKGGSILRQIEGYMGEDLFRKGIQKYLTSHAYACAASHHLWEAFEAVTGMPITAVMKSWIEQPGHPILTARREGDRLILTQKRFTYLPQQNDQTWKVPVALSLFDEKDQRHAKNFLMDAAEMNLELGADCKAYKLNYNQTGFYRVEYEDRDNYDVLMDYVVNKKLPLKDRWGLQADAFAQVLCGGKTMADYLEMLTRFADEDAFLPLISILDNLFLAYEVLDSKWQTAVSAVGRSMCDGILRRIGYDPGSDEAHTVSLLRDHILWPAAVFGLSAAKEFAAEKFKTMQAGGTVHPDIQKSVLQIAALTGGADTLAWFRKRAETSASEHERLNLYAALACFGTWERVRSALDFALEHVPPRNRFIPIAAAAENPHAAPSIWQWFRNHIDALEKIHPLLYERIVGAVVPFGGVHQPSGIKEFLEERLNTNHLAADAIRISLERLEIFTQMRSRHAAMTPSMVSKQAPAQPG